MKRWQWMTIILFFAAGIFRMDAQAQSIWEEEGKGVVAFGADLTEQQKDTVLELFGITREQLAAILHRYVAYKGYDTTSSADLSGYSDGAQVSAYALEAMGWATAQGLVNGTGNGRLSPKNGAVRAEVAAVLMRLCEKTAR